MCESYRNYRVRGTNQIKLAGLHKAVKLIDVSTTDDSDYYVVLTEELFAWIHSGLCTSDVTRVRFGQMDTQVKICFFSEMNADNFMVLEKKSES